MLLSSVESIYNIIEKLIKYKGDNTITINRISKNILVKTWKNEDERLNIKTSLLLKKAQYPTSVFIQAFCDKAIKELNQDYKEG
ncbi:hypothetical protein [Lactococcus phage PMBT68]|nr:hypothetical protein [Lactococcus phage P1411]